MKKKYYLLLVLSLAISSQARSQAALTRCGIHYSGGYSNDTLVSSNIGSSCEARGSNAFAGGDQSTAEGIDAFAFGYKSQATGSYTYALGNLAYATGQKSIALGFYVRSLNATSIVIGSGYSSSNPLKTSAAGITMGMGSKNPTLFISKAGSSQKTGKVAIGNVTPTAKLHIRSDDGEDAGIILEPYDPTANETFIQLRDGQHQIMVDRHGTMELSSDNNLLGVSSTNFVIDGNLLKLGTVNHRTFTFLSDNTSSIGWNASPLNGYYTRGDTGSSYVLEFSDAALKVRTAPYEEPRRDPIENWTDALTLGVGGAVTLNGRVGVNIENSYPGYALAVDGGILTTKVHIQEVSRWEDRVFGEDYRLMPLGEVEAYVAANRHLPGVPSEAEVRADGYDVAEMQAVLLGKIEELTLHVIRQQKEIDSLRTLVTVRFGYDACGNRVSRTLEFSRVAPDAAPGGTSPDTPEEWQASLSDRFEGVETTLSPNPTEGGFILSIGGELPKDAKAVLCTLDGKVLEERGVSSATEAFDLGGMPAGVYLLRLASERETKVWKVIKRN